jgi:hypothetical protein
MRAFKSEKFGFVLVEVLLGVSVLGLLATFLVGGYLFGEEAAALSGHRFRASALAQEGLEAVRNIRDDSFANLTDGTHGLAISGSQWTFSGSSDATDIFTREVVISAVDSNRKNVIVNVDWQQNAQRTGMVSLVTYLTNWMAANPADWVTPSQEASLDFSGGENGLKIQVQGNYAYIVRNGGAPDFLVVDISNTASPSVVGSLTLTGTPQNIAVSGSYAYVVSGADAEELQIINVSSPSSPSVVGTYNATGGANMLGVYVVGTTVYLTRASSTNDEFYIVNASTPASPSLTGSLGLGADSNEVWVSGNYAYVASSSDPQELQVIGISTPAAPSLAGSLDLATGSNAFTVTGLGSTIIVGRANGEVTTINVATPSSPSFLGTYDVGSAANDLAVDSVSNYVFVASDTGSADFQVIDINIPASPSLVGSLNAAANLNGVAFSQAKNRVFAVGNAAAEEFIVIAPQ